MAISRLVAPSDPATSDANWTQLINWVKLALLSIELPFRMDWANGLIKKGAIFHVSGTPYLNDTDATPSGTASNYVKLTPSGDGSVLSASYVANLTGVTWNTTYNGWYDGGTPACLYIFDDHLAYANEVTTAIRENRNINFFRHTRLNLGIGNRTNGGFTTATGNNNTSSAPYACCHGSNNDATGDSATAIGNNCEAGGERSVSMGSYEVTTRNDEAAICGMRKVYYPDTDTENTVFDHLYVMLGSDPTARTIGCIGNFGIYAINEIKVIDAADIQLLDKLGNIVLNLDNGILTGIGSTLKIMFLDGGYL